MKKDFKSFTSENKKILDENKDKIDDIEKLLDKYRNMDNNQLMYNLLSEANRLKREGKLDRNELNGIKNTLTPFLNSEQQQLLNEIINKINE